MELTQRLECTQELFGPTEAKSSPEEIGFLGICGLKYPVKKGPNKIGRDPQSCNIVLKLESISRHHAVINILNNNDHMLMDLGSANKTRLENKVLQPYIPYPIRNGDTVQFGNVFGIFKLHQQDDDDLPMTQAIDIPETPLPACRISKLNKVHGTTIPESPDVSDKDDSFIVPSQPKHAFKSPNNFIKSSNKIIAIQPLGTKKIDNAYWNSSKKSDSFTSNGSFSDIIDTHKLMSSININKKNKIHELETQVPQIEHNGNIESIFEANTQAADQNLPSQNIYNMETQVPKTDSPETSKINNNDGINLIYSANTQIPKCFTPKSSIFDADAQIPRNRLYDAISDMETQVPTDKVQSNLVDIKNSIHDANTQIAGIPKIFDMETQVDSNNLPAICKLQEQHELHFNFSISKKEKENKSRSIEEKDVSSNYHSKECLHISKKSEDQILRRHNSSDDVILFDDIDSQAFNDDCDSQPLLPSDLEFITLQSSKKNENKEEKQCFPRSSRLKSDSSTDCEDFDLMLTQKISNKSVDGDVTECENIAMKDCDIEDDTTDCEDELVDGKKANDKKETKAEFEDVPTQIIEVDVIQSGDHGKQNVREDIADMLTQKIMNDDGPLNSITIEDLPTQVIIEEENIDIKNATNPSSPFKIPMISPLKSRKVLKQKTTDSCQSLKNIEAKYNQDDYYDCTQDIFNDLCSQRGAVTDENTLTKTVELLDSNKNKSSCRMLEDPSTETDCENRISIDKSTDSSDVTIKVDDFIAKLSKHEVCNIIGVNKEVAPLKKNPSDSSSDVEITPKKHRPFKFMETELPNSQEIKSSVSLASRQNITLSSSDSETENDSEQFTPILYHKKKKTTNDVKKDLTKSLDVDALPSRVLTRVRKPTTKVLDNFESKSNASNILKPKYLMEQEDNIDNEIIVENINRLKCKTEKNKLERSKKWDNEKEKSTKTGSKHSSNKERERKSKNKEKRNNNLKNDSKQDLSKTNKTSLPNESRESTHTTRYTRSRHKDKIETSTRLPEKKVTENTHKSAYTSKKNDERNSQEMKTRSKSRHKLSDNAATKLKEESNVESAKHEDSTVYSVSSDSSVNSPCRFKRPASNIEMPLPKKSKTDLSISSVSSRSTPSRRVKKQLVLFTAFPVNEVKDKLEELGASIVTDVMACTVVLTLQIKRTFKLLCAVGLGKPIVGPDWVQACADSNTIVDPWLYLMKDEVTENRFQFNLRKTLSGKRNFLKGYKVSCTPNVLPTAQELELIVKSSGGVWKSGGRNWLCVSCSKDKHLWPELKQNGATIVNTELILGGVLRQKLEIDKNKLM